MWITEQVSPAKGWTGLQAILAALLVGGTRMGGQQTLLGLTFRGTAPNVEARCRGKRDRKEEQP